MPRRVVARKITRKQAEAYERTVPNPMGVTTIAAVNERGAYARRYAATRALLGQSDGSEIRNNRKKRKKRKRSQKRNSSMQRGTSVRRRARLRRRGYKRRATRNRRGFASVPVQLESPKPKRKKRRKKKAAKRTTKRSTTKRRTTKRTAKRRTTKRSTKRTTKRRATRRKATRRAAPKRRSTGKRRAPKRKASRKGKRRTSGRVYGKGRYKTLRARIGRFSRPTYMYETKKGRLRKVPKHGYLGYRSSAEMRRAHLKHPERAARDQARWERVEARRGRASISAVEGRSPFTPNRRRPAARRTITFEEWEKSMKANAKRRRKKTSSKKRRVKRRGTSKRRRATTSRRKRTTRKRRAPSRRRASSTRRRRRKSGSTAKRRVSRRKGGRRVKRRSSRRRVRRNARVTQVAANRPRRRRRRARRNMGHGRRRGRKLRRNAKIHSGGMRGFFRRGFLRNQAASFTQDMVHVLKVGGVVVIGYLAHRALSRVVSDNVLAKAAMFQSGTGAAYKDVAAGALVALVGVPLAAKFAPKDAKLIGAGIMASWLQNAIVTVLSQMGQTDVVAYLGDYTEAEGNPQYSGYGSYYEFTPGQVFGEYYTTPGMSGFGDIAVDQLTQAAAGFGQPRVAGLYQAAAGMGASPMLTQAAAGMGEYFVQGANGIGEYEEVTPQYTAPHALDEGISPDLTSAERALSVAEAAAGVGAYGDNTVPLQSTVYPTGVPEAIPDMPGGSRAGTFAGNNGVFGPAH